MDEEELKFITCTRKIRYRTKKKAVIVLAKMRSRLRLTPPQLGCYKCRFCSFYHIGNSSPVQDSAYSDYNQFPAATLENDLDQFGIS